MTFLFATAIDNRCPLLPGERRVDQMDRCGHYARWEEDFEIVRELGVRALRYGPAYYRTHLGPDHYDWESCDEQLLRLRELGIEVIADLCHFGVPTWLGGFQDPAFPVLFAEYARGFARRYPWIRYFTPVNEILQGASCSALRGWWNECETSDAAFVRALRNLCLAHESAVEAILGERPDAIIVQNESLEYYPVPGTQAGERERWHALRFLALDLTLGHELPPGVGGYLQDNGVTSNELSFFRERRATGRRWIALERSAGVESRALVTECHARYGVPIVHGGAPDVRERAVLSMHEQWQGMLALRAQGIPVNGFAWSTLTDIVGWERGLGVAGNDVRTAGLCDLNREVRDVGEDYAALVARWSRALALGVLTTVERRRRARG
jgi:beta-glucosidase/6-phospho-beta-glucosidase/beta-galactosidase